MSFLRKTRQRVRVDVREHSLGIPMRKRPWQYMHVSEDALRVYLVAGSLRPKKHVVLLLDDETESGVEEDLDRKRILGRRRWIRTKRPLEPERHTRKDSFQTSISTIIGAFSSRFNISSPPPPGLWNPKRGHYMLLNN